jgi:hypothetical protein
MTEVERLASVLTAARDHNFVGLSDAAVGLDFRISQIIESAQDVVIPGRRKRVWKGGPTRQSLR